MIARLRKRPLLISELCESAERGERAVTSLGGQAASTLDNARATLSSVSRKVFLSLMDAAVRPYQFEPPAHIGTGIDWTNSSEGEGDNDDGGHSTDEDQQIQQQQPNAECTWSVCLFTMPRCTCLALHSSAFSFVHHQSSA